MVLVPLDSDCHDCVNQIPVLFICFLFICFNEAFSFSKPPPNRLVDRLTDREREIGRVLLSNIFMESFIVRRCGPLAQVAGRQEANCNC